MFDPDSICIEDFNYTLPDDKIAQFPLARRDASKLLIYDHGRISDDIFSRIDRYLPDNSLLIFNNTRVIHARLKFRKSTGAQIEIFCLEPISPSCELQTAFQQRAASTWKCLVGNLKRWKSGAVKSEIEHQGLLYQLFAERKMDCGDGCFEIEFRWNPPEKTFSEILDLIGLVPLPPYITRPAVSSDNDRYQTIYAIHEGSVAAPTAGLHFTGSILDRLRKNGVKTENVTLHVGIGTFRPVSTGPISEHVMHQEKIIISRNTIEQLILNQDRPVIAIGTTSARTIESLYWLGVRLINEGPGAPPVLSQWDPYIQKQVDEIPVKRSLETLIDFLDANRLEEFAAETRLMIIPGYRYRLVSGLITNFHMPKSTLLLLVAAMIGKDWETAYQHALQNDFRFLSYGDSCLFFNPMK